MTEATSVPPTVLPAKLTLLPVNPATGSLKATVNWTGDAPVGSTCPLAWLIVTVGRMMS